MKHFHTRLRQLREILNSYSFPMPFSNHLKLYYKKHKTLGGKDRKEIRALAYAFLRVANAMEGQKLEPIAETAALFMGLHAENETDIALLEQFSTTTDLSEKARIIQESGRAFDVTKLFPFVSEMSDVFQNPEFQLSFLSQPDVWIKINRNKLKEVKEEFAAAHIEYQIHTELIFSVSTEAKLTDLNSFKDGWFRIQDLSSQQTADYFNPDKGEIWWDCCAGAGGKCLALLEKEPDIHLYASDLRELILKNLEERLFPGMEPADRKSDMINVFAADVSKPINGLKLPAFDGIIIDAPCTGSGTWARNPENLVYFKPKQIADYQKKQLAILENVLPFLKEGKPLIYITCSVFKQENEDVISRFIADFPVEVVEQKYLEGYKHGAENMFLCSMIKTGK